MNAIILLVIELERNFVHMHPAMKRVFLELPKIHEPKAKLLGFVVISKNFLCTRKIMVMHMRGGECDLRTLVDRQRKR